MNGFLSSPYTTCGKGEKRCSHLWLENEKMCFFLLFSHKTTVTKVRPRTPFMLFFPPSSSIRFSLSLPWLLLCSSFPSSLACMSATEEMTYDSFRHGGTQRPPFSHFLANRNRKKKLKWKKKVSGYVGREAECGSRPVLGREVKKPPQT